jgi:hypothetical protein
LHGFEVEQLYALPDEWLLILLRAYFASSPAIRVNNATLVHRAHRVL